MHRRAFVLAGIAAALLAGPALAHHSFAMFDGAKSVELQGTVKEFVWTNPHSWLKVMVADPQGQMDEWTLEMGGPGGLANQGWRPKTVVPGDKVTVTLHPLKDGTHGGQFLSATLADGRKLSGGGAAPARNAGND